MLAPLETPKRKLVSNRDGKITDSFNTTTPVINKFGGLEDKVDKWRPKSKKVSSCAQSTVALIKGDLHTHNKIKTSKY